MYETVENLLGTVKIGGRAVPFKHMKFTDKSLLYIVYTLMPETPAICADDVAKVSVVQLDIDIYAKNRRNLTETIGAVKETFINAGWSWAEDSPDIFEDDTGYLHKTITFEIERSL